MKVALSQTSSEDRKNLASYFASQSVATETDRPSEILSRGKVLAERGDRTRGIAACAACHDAAGVNEAYPRLAGQPVPYLENQLGLFRSGSRGGGAYAGVMTRAAAGLSDDDIQALATYYGALPKD